MVGDQPVDAGAREGAERGEHGGPEAVGVGGQRHGVGLATVDRGHDDLRTVHAVDLVRDERTGRPRVERAGDEVVAVDAFAGQGEEQPARGEAAGVELHGAGHGRRRVTTDQPTADYPRDLAEGEVDHGVLSSVSPVGARYPSRLTSSSAALARSSNGCTTPATS